MPLLESLVAATIVSSVPTLLMTAVVMKRGGGKTEIENSDLMDHMVAFATGALLADASHHLSNSQSELNILISITLFFVTDLLLSLSSRPHHSDGGHPHPHHHHHHHKPGGQNGHVAGHNDGLIALIGDAVHNFTDGIALASAMSNPARGLKTVLAITLHEIPHQFADYAILFRAGYRLADIIKSQCLTAVACFVGVFVGVLGARIDEELLEAFTSGGFLYLSLCTLAPTVKGSRCNPVGLIASFAFGILLITLF